MNTLFRSTTIETDAAEATCSLLSHNRCVNPAVKT